MSGVRGAVCVVDRHWQSFRILSTARHDHRIVSAHQLDDTFMRLPADEVDRVRYFERAGQAAEWVGLSAADDGEHCLAARSVELINGPDGVGESLGFHQETNIDQPGESTARGPGLLREVCGVHRRRPVPWNDLRGIDANVFQVSTRIHVVVAVDAPDTRAIESTRPVLLVAPPVGPEIAPEETISETKAGSRRGDALPSKRPQ